MIKFGQLRNRVVGSFTILNTPVVAEIDVPPLAKIEKNADKIEKQKFDDIMYENMKSKPWSLHRLMTSIRSNAPPPAAEIDNPPSLTTENTQITY